MYLLNVFFKKSSKGADEYEELNPHENKDPLEHPFEEIRREILQKKLERQRVEEAEGSIEIKESEETQVARNWSEAEAPSQFQTHLEEQALQIKQKQEEAERLKANLAQIKKDQYKKKANQSQTTSVYSSEIVAKKVKSILGNKSDIKAALVAGEILREPLAMRR